MAEKGGSGMNDDNVLELAERLRRAIWQAQEMGFGKEATKAALDRLWCCDQEISQAFNEIKKGQSEGSETA
jgi:hypothetical protein